MQGMAARKSVLKPAPPRPDLDKLLESARRRDGASEVDLAEQRISFAYGNAPFSAATITKESVRDSSRRLRLMR